MEEEVRPFQLAVPSRLPTTSLPQRLSGGDYNEK